MTTPECARRPGRPRERRVDRAITTAALEIFADEGYHALSMESVATRAGVGKATIYRRWPGKKELVIDALATLNDELLTARRQLPERTDDRIRAILRDLATRDTDSLTGRIMPRMIVYSVSQPDLYAEYFQRVIMPRRRWLHEILREGVRRGDLRPDLDVEVAALALVGPTLMPARGLGLDPHGEDLARRLFEVLWPGLTAPGPARPEDGRISG
ncbi:MAG TPA: TetR/AcrR family transcriptional regulator [Nakamurella sp.]